MSDQQFSPVVDADGHVLEPGDTYQNYIDPQYRDRAIRIEVDERGYEDLIIDNRPYQSKTMRGNLGAIGGIGMDRKKLFARGEEVARMKGRKIPINLDEVILGMPFMWGANTRLINLVGMGKAKEIVMTGDVVTAEEALTIGLVNQVVPPDLLSCNVTEDG